MFESLDRSLFLFLNTALANPVFDAVFCYITETSHWYLPLAAAAVVALVRVERAGNWWIRVRMRDGWRVTAQVVLLAGLTVALTDPFCQRVLKPLFGRLRPCDPRALVEGGRFLLGHRRSLAMPSIHAANMAGMATALTWHWPKRWLWFCVPALLVALSRVYVGVHYPGDVLAGMLVGAVAGSAVYWGWRATARRLTGRKAGSSSEN